MRIRIVFAACLALALLIVASVAVAVGPITFSEPEFPAGTPVNGLVVNTVNGVPIATLSFTYTISGSGSANAKIQDLGLASNPFVQPLYVGGSAPNASLAIDFGADVPSVSFGLARLSGTGPMGTLTALDSGGGTVGTANLLALADPGSGVSGLQVSFTGATGFRRIRLDFLAGAEAFALDNLTYAGRPSSGAAAVPTLDSWAVAALTLGLAVLGLRAFRH